MKNYTPYKFENDGWSVELKVYDPSNKIYSPDESTIIPFKIKGLKEVSALEYEPFCFFEWQNIQYSFTIEKESRFTPPFHLCINNRVENTSDLRSSIHLFTGQFSFEDQVGETRIEIRDSRNQVLFELETEVFPQKMDYKSDYRAMLSEITDVIQSLAFDTLKDTFRKTKARLKGKSTENEWWNILDALFEELFISIGVIKKLSKHDIRVKEQPLSVDKIKQSSKKNIQWLSKNGKYSNRIDSGIKVTETHSFSHCLSRKKYVTYDTYENRFIVWAVRDIIKHLREYCSYINKVSGKRDYSPLINKIRKYQGQLQSALHGSPFNEVGEFEGDFHFSSSLTKGAGYKDFLHIYLILSRGLEIAENDIFKIEQKNISTLYEYWCFLKLVKILKEQNSSSLIFQDIVKIQANKFSVNLQKGNTSKVVFKKPQTSDTTTIYFNKQFEPREQKVFTYSQRPDYALEFKKQGFNKSFWYLFDAKYRFENKPEKESPYNAPNDAIGQLHRYRDAILHSNPESTTYKKAIKNLGGVILYPYPLEESSFKNNVYFKSIQSVNIGALPMLPTKFSLVNDFLNDLINKKLPEEHFEQFVEMDNSEYEQYRNLWKEWITIGVIPKTNQEERLRFISEKQLYHIPFIADLDSKVYLSKKLLLCKAGTNEAILYDVVRWQIFTVKELREKGTTWQHRDSKYMVFELENAKSILTPEKLAPVKFRFATQEGMNRYLLDPERNRNYFYITNPDAARLYEELKAKEIDFKVSWVNDTNDPSLIEFECKGNKVRSSMNFPTLFFLYNDEYQSIYKIIEAI